MLSLRLAASLRTGSLIARRSVCQLAAVPACRASSRVHLLSAISGAGLYTAWNLRRARCEALLENPWLLTPHVKPILEKRSLLINCVYLPWYLLCGSWIFLRRITRCLTLAIRFLPLAVTYPLARRMDFLHELWWTCVLYAIQSSGPTFIKLGQWASTRRDIFSKEFCDRMSVLHTKTRRQRSFRDCDQVLDEIFGENFAKNHKEEVFVQIEPYSIGSGCIAQVYKGTVNVPALEKVTGRKIPQLEGLVEREVAIKVAERGVEDKINLDLSILRNATSLVLRILPSLGYLEPLSALDQFEMVLRRQVDLRNEARALQKFTENFDHKKTGVKFPIVLGYTKNAIVETFEHGMYINRLVAEEHDPELAARQSPRVRRRIALLGARALLKMIFVDNFVHGDLHPGNILIRFNDDQEKLPGVHNAPPRESLLARFVEVVRDLIGWRDVPRVRFTDSPDLADEPTLVMLDTGIVVSETEKNLRNLKALFRAIIEKQGYKAGELLLTHAENSRNCVDPHQFCLQVDELVKKAMKEKSLRSGFCVFVVETLPGGRVPPSCEWFLEWLEDVAADSKQKRKANFEALKFAIVGFGSSEDGETQYNRVSRTVLKRMKILGSKQIMNVALFDVSEPESSLSERYSNLSDLLLQSIDKHLPGAEESETESEFSTDASDEESEEDEPRDKKRQ